MYLPVSRSVVYCFLSCLAATVIHINGQEVQQVKTNATILIRLRGGDKPTEGRVEISYNGEWGTVCDDDWGIEAANIICKMVGYDGALEYVHSGKFGPGEGTIWLDNVHCTGEEEDITGCSFHEWGDHDCSHHEDAGVKCSTRRLPGFFNRGGHTVEGLDVIRLKPPKGQKRYIPQLDGYVEIHHDDRWTKICTETWNQHTATVICGQLGFPAAEKIRHRKSYLAKAKRKHNYWVTNVTCLGTETKLSECRFSTLVRPSSKGCKHGQPLLVQCIPGYKYSRGGRSKKSKKKGRKRRRFGFKKPTSIRLKAGSSEGEGRIEVKRNGRWGTVCHRQFNILSANVACRELGYGTAKREQRNSFYGHGHGPVWLSNVRCYGNETRLTQCEHENISRSYSGYENPSAEECTHHEDAGVSCHIPQLNSRNRIRLVGGRNPMEGRLEVKVHKKWGPICSDGWSAKEAMVACKQLGFGFALHALKDVYFFPGSENATSLMMTGVQCNGDESALHSCKNDGTTLSSCGDPRRSLTPYAGVICTELSPDLIQDVQLLQQSIHLDDQPLHNLYCAHEENCLAPSAADVEWPYGSRRLLRFSTRVWNRGRADFRPARSKEQWIWHQCHGHYHSMSAFTHYDILDLNFTKVAEGHKASFCLEDSECDSGVSPRFDCDQPGGGVQGIAVGCSDNYQYNIDCQWIDITDVKKGNYLIRIRVNPDALVAESDFTNNEVFCNLQYDGHRVWAWNCHIRDDYDAEAIAQYYTASVYP